VVLEKEIVFDDTDLEIAEKLGHCQQESTMLKTQCAPQQPKKQKQARQYNFEAS